MELELGPVDRIARIGIKHCIPGIHQGKEKFTDRGFATRLDGNVFHAVVRAVGSTYVSSQRITELRNTCVWAITGLPVLHCFDGCLDYVVRSGDVISPKWKGYTLLPSEAKAAASAETAKAVSVPKRETLSAIIIGLAPFRCYMSGGPGLLAISWNA